MLDEILARFDKMPADKQKEFNELVDQSVPDQVWYPEPKNLPQCKAYVSKADILLYGGQPGGGKTALILGTAATRHKRSLIVRKQFSDLDGLVDNLQGMLGSSKGIARGTRPKYKSEDGRIISFQGMSATGDIDTGKQGNAFDFIGVDEAAQLPENDVRLLIGWNRVGSGVESTQRCRVILASNPPVNSTGDWIGTFFAPWLDPKHHSPAKHGELRWFYFDEDGKSIETDQKQPFEHNGIMRYPHSRTYIPAKVEDNPYINAEEYKQKLQSIPEPFRTMLTSGNFLAVRKDQDFQVIPTSWVQKAVSRWEERKGLKPEGIPMCSIGLDCAGGGADNAVIARRYDYHYPELIKFKTNINEYGSEMAGRLMLERRDSAEIGIDMGGGYGSAVWNIIKNNLGSDKLKAYKGGEGATRRSSDGKMSFKNLRSQMYWEFREALDPDQEGGSAIELPNDPRLLAGLTCPTFTTDNSSNRIDLETKIEVVKKLGFSPDEADAVIIAWWAGRKWLTPDKSYKQQNHLPSSIQMKDKYLHRRK